MAAALKLAMIATNAIKRIISDLQRRYDLIIPTAETPAPNPQIATRNCPGAVVTSWLLFVSCACLVEITAQECSRFSFPLWVYTKRRLLRGFRRTFSPRQWPI